VGIASASENSRKAIRRSREASVAIADASEIPGRRFVEAGRRLSRSRTRLRIPGRRWHYNEFKFADRPEPVRFAFTNYVRFGIDERARVREVTLQAGQTPLLFRRVEPAAGRGGGLSESLARCAAADVLKATARAAVHAWLSALRRQHFCRLQIALNCPAMTTVSGRTGCTARIWNVPSKWSGVRLMISTVPPIER
jgi:hypothetical protein